ncbi:unnamed protein product [Oppiella nova]|uniref:Dymeclin n=1 Tax=Oppiella nova TaxID=334625 RepID=A0A7R9QLS3_9ACAR|nr:unnamed protein product [Oppiella nova]CAG2167525.1 unnamed protein product [Oppiella nova]
MGLNVSSLNNLKQNQYLTKLVSNEHMSTDPSNHDYWDQLLSFAFDNLPQICNDQKFVDENISPLLSSLVENNLSSHNIGSIVRIVIDKTSKLKEGKSEEQSYNLIVWQTYNSLFILRSAAKYLIETLTEDNIIRHFTAKVDTNEKKTEESGLVMIEQLLITLIEILVDIPLSDMTYNLHLEAINGLLVLLSTQMYSARPANKSSIYRLVMQKKCAIHALLLTKSLLTNFVSQRPAPELQGGSIILGLASGLWNVLTLGYAAKGVESDKPPLLSRQSLLLLLVLTNHCTTDSNPYREALFGCCDSQMDSQIAADQTVTGFKIEFASLYKTLCITLNDDQTTLLLYMLLHRNHYFKSFVLSRALDLDQFVIPILKILYTSPDRNSHHIYMALIILLVLSEDNLFNESVHDITLKNIVWYADRQLTEISLGGLIILVIIRTIQYNMSRARDRFLHTNLCATLANMSNHFKRLNPYVCQRLVSLFEKLSKKFNRILKEVKTNETKTNGIDQSDVSSDCETSSVAPDLQQDLSIFEEVLRMILEIINACLAAQLTNNPNLVYTLLYKRQVLEPFQSHPCFQDIVMNIETVLTYFSNRIEAIDRNLSVSEVYEIIQQSSLQWPSDRLKKFPELRFRYVEDEQPEEFFIPYIWSLVFRSSHIHWNSQNILLFNPNRNN